MPRYSEKRRAALEATMRDEVHRVAAAILRTEGLAALSLDRIAREVGVSRGTLYNYFADADAVMNFVETRTFAPVAERIDAIAASDLEPQAQLEAIVRTILDAMYEDRALAMALFEKQQLHGPRAEQKRRNRERVVAVVERIIADGIDHGSLRVMPPRLAAEVLLGALIGLIESMLYAGELRPADDVVPGMMDVLRGGLDPRPDPADAPGPERRRPDPVV